MHTTCLLLVVVSVVIAHAVDFSATQRNGLADVCAVKACLCTLYITRTYFPFRGRDSRGRWLSAHRLDLPAAYLPACLSSVALFIDYLIYFDKLRPGRALSLINWSTKR